MYYLHAYERVHADTAFFAGLVLLYSLTCVRVCLCLNGAQVTVHYDDDKQHIKFHNTTLLPGHVFALRSLLVSVDQRHLCMRDVIIYVCVTASTQASMHA